MEVVFLEIIIYTIVYYLYHFIIFCHFIAVCRRQLEGNCRLPTANEKTRQNDRYNTCMHTKMIFTPPRRLCSSFIVLKMTFCIQIPLKIIIFLNVFYPKYRPLCIRELLVNLPENGKGDGSPRLPAEFEMTSFYQKKTMLISHREPSMS